MKLFQKIRFKTIIILVLSFLVLSFFAFIAAFAEEEGTLGTSFLAHFLAVSFKIICFPTIILFEKFFSSGIAMLFIGLLINILLYSFLIERSIFFYKKFKADSRDKKKE